MPPRKTNPLTTASVRACNSAVQAKIYITKSDIRGTDNGQRTANAAFFFNLPFHEFVGRALRPQHLKAPGAESNALKKVIMRKMSFCNGERSGYWLVVTVYLSLPLVKWWSIAKALGADEFFIKDDFKNSTSWYDKVVERVVGSTVYDLDFNEPILRDALARAYSDIQRGEAVPAALLSPSHTPKPHHSSVGTPSSSYNSSVDTPSSSYNSSVGTPSSYSYNSSVGTPSSCHSSVATQRHGAESYGATYSLAQIHDQDLSHVRRDLSIVGLCCSPPPVAATPSSSHFDPREDDSYYSRDGDLPFCAPTTPRTTAHIEENGLLDSLSPYHGGGGESSYASMERDTTVLQQSQIVDRESGSCDSSSLADGSLGPVQSADDGRGRPSVYEMTHSDIQAHCVAFLKSAAPYTPDQLASLASVLQNHYHRFTRSSGDVALTILGNPQLNYVAAALALEECLLASMGALVGSDMPPSFSKDFFPNLGAGSPDIFINRAIHPLVLDVVESRKLGYEFGLIDPHAICFVLAVDAVERIVHPYSTVSDMAPPSHPLTDLWIFIREHVRAMAEWIHKLCILSDCVIDQYLSKGVACPPPLQAILDKVRPFREPPLSLAKLRTRNLMTLGAVMKRIQCKFNTVKKILSFIDSNQCHGYASLLQANKFNWAVFAFISQSKDHPLQLLARTQFSPDGHTGEDMDAFDRCVTQFTLEKNVATPALLLLASPPPS